MKALEARTFLANTGICCSSFGLPSRSCWSVRQSRTTAVLLPPCLLAYIYSNKPPVQFSTAIHRPIQSPTHVFRAGVGASSGLRHRLGLFLQLLASRVNTVADSHEDIAALHLQIQADTKKNEHATDASAKAELTYHHEMRHKVLVRLEATHLQLPVGQMHVAVRVADADQTSIRAHARDVHALLCQRA